MLARLEPTAWALVDWAKDAALPPAYTAENRFMLSFSMKVARR